MLKDITKIKISGAIFDTPVTLDFFNPHEGDKLKTVKGALLYGRNGTGKSTIARAFRKIAGENILVISSAVAYDIEDQYVMLNEEDKKHIFIFDEDYIQKNVRLQQDHLETIVMLGHAADLTEKIKEAETERDKAKTDYERQVDVFKEYCDSSNVKSPKYCILSLVNSLRGDDNWSGRDREIMGGRQNTSVREDTYKKFVKLMPAKQKTELIVDYKVKREELQAAQTGATTIDIKVPSLSKLYSDYDDKTVQMLLAMKIEKPELSEREQKLFALVQRRKSEELSQRLIILRNKDTMQCPYCFQLLQQEYRESLVKSIEKVLNEAVKDHQSVLQKNVFAIIDLNLDPFEKLSGYKECVDLIELVNTMILGNNENLKSKIENPYTPIDTQTTDVKALVPQLIKAVEDLEKVREMYNKAAKKTDTIVFEMNRINSEIAHYDVKVLSTLLEKQQEEYDAAEKLLKELKAIYDVGKKAVEKLESERKNIRLALDSINACMKYIFFADDRLKIEYVDGVYKLLSHGKNVNPCDVSVGERNIIGLSYFFTSIFENQEEKDAYGKEYLIVVDDPVSSFDMENKIGILSFLKYKLGAFLEENQNTRALVMTHDLMTFYDVHKVFEEIIEACKPKGYTHTPKFNRFEMRDGNLIQFQNKRQEYTEIIKAIYYYASEQSVMYELIIGNMMRQVLEAFSTFQYKKGIEEVSTDANILSLLQEPEYILYYKNLMYRLVLHSGSHREEQIKSMNDFNFFSLISDTEKKRTAKDVLCFIYLLNERHLLEHLKGCGGIEVELQSWCQDIKTRATVI